MLKHLVFADFDELLQEVVTDFLQVGVLLVGISPLKDHRKQLVCDEVEGLAKSRTQRILNRLATALQGIVRRLLSPRGVEFIPRLITEVI